MLKLFNEAVEEINAQLLEEKKKPKGKKSWIFPVIKGLEDWKGLLGIEKGEDGKVPSFEDYYKGSGKAMAEDLLKALAKKLGDEKDLKPAERKVTAYKDAMKGLTARININPKANAFLKDVRDAMEGMNPEA